MGGCYMFLTDLRDSQVVLSLNISRQQEKEILSDHYYKSPYVIITFCLTVLLISINALLIFGLVKTNKSLTRSHKLYIFLSSVDICAEFVLSLTYMYFNSTTFKSTCAKDAVAMAIFVFFFLSGKGVFLTISVVRNSSIREPLVQIKLRKIFLTLGIYQVLPLVISVFTYLAYYPGKMSSRFLVSYWFLITAYLLFEVILVSYFNIRSWRSLASKKLHLLESGGNRSYRRQKNAVVILMVITCVYAICNLPLSVYYSYLATTMVTFEENPDLYFRAGVPFTYFHVPAILCTGINALVYMLKSPEIKRFYKGLICRQQRRKLSSSSVYSTRTNQVSIKIKDICRQKLSSSSSGTLQHDVINNNFV